MSGSAAVAGRRGAVRSGRRLAVVGWLCLCGGLAGWAQNPADTLNLLELSSLDALERDTQLAAFWDRASRRSLSTLRELAESPELTGRQFGALALTLERLTEPGDLDWGRQAALAKHPATRYAGVVVVRAPGNAAAREALLGLLDSPHADVRSGAALALRRWHEPEVVAKLRQVAETGRTAAERSCASAAGEWIAAATEPTAHPPRRTVTVAGGDANAVVAGLRTAAVVAIAPDTRLLGTEAVRSAVSERVRAGATLYVRCGNDGALPAGVGELLTALGLPLPATVPGGDLPLVCNLLEAHPLQDYVHDLAAGRAVLAEAPAEASPDAALAPLKIADAKAIALQLRPWFLPVPAVFTGWDAQVWAAPFTVLGNPRLAGVLEAPSARDRGRVLLDRSGAGLSLWEASNNVRALLEGPEALIPLKILYRGNYDRATIQSVMPAPYLNVDESVVTPHVPWAKPLAGGPLRVGLALPEIMIRSGIELHQRLDATVTWLPFCTHFFGSFDPKKAPRPPLILDAGSTLRLQRWLESPGDVLVLPAFAGLEYRINFNVSWSALPADLRGRLTQRVRDGLGLVVLGPDFPNAAGPEWGARPVPLPPEVRRSIPVSDETARSLVACYALGRGRLVHFRRRLLLGTADLTLGRGFLVPGLAAPLIHRADAKEYAWSLVTAATLWAGNRQQADTGAVTEVWYLDRFGFRRPERPAGGAAVVETRYLDGNAKVLGWAAQRLGPDTPVEPKVALARRLLVPREALRAAITAAGEALGEQAVVEVLDGEGRVRRRQTLPLAEGRAEVTLPGWTPIGRWHDLRVVILRQGQAVAESLIPFAVDTRVPDLDLVWWAVPAPTPFLPGLKHAGIRYQPGGRGHALPHLADVPPAARDDLQTWDAYDLAVRNGLETMWPFGWFGLDVEGPQSDTVPSLADPSFLAQLRGKVAHDAERYRLLGLRRYDLQNEFSLPPDRCWSPVTLTGFRRYLHGAYPDLASLNQAWGRAFATWGDVRPDSLATAVARKNLVAWSAHRAFMESLVARWWRTAEDTLDAEIPGARVGLSCCAQGEPDSGVDVATALHGGGYHTQYVYPDPLLARSFARPDAILGCYVPYAFDRDLKPAAVAEATVIPHQMFLEGFSEMGVWWGYEDFGWPFLRPDLTPCTIFQAMATEVHLLQGGIDWAVRGAVRADQALAGYYSQPSLRTLHGLRQMTGKEPPVGADYGLSARLLAPLHVTGHLIGPEQLVANELDPTRTRLLALLGVVALSEAELAGLERYVEAGGNVVADTLPGAWTELSAPRDQRRIAALFGVAAEVTALTPGPGAPAKLAATGPFVELNGLGPMPPPLPRLTLASATSHGRLGECPALIGNTRGRGRTLLLNLPPRAALGLAQPGPGVTWPPDPAAARKWAVALAGWAGIRPVLEVSDAATGQPLAPGTVYVFDDGVNMVLGIGNAWSPARQVKLRWLAPRTVYDLRTPGNPQTGDTVTVTLPPQTAGYWVATLQPLPPLTGTVRLAADGELELSLEATGGRRLARISVTDPNQRLRGELASKIQFTGTGRLSIPVALSDPAGRWLVQVTDVVTGQRLDLPAEVAR